MEYRFEILNLKCGGCANTIDKKIKSIAEVQNVTIDIENSTVIIKGDVDPSEIETTLKKLGYPIKGDSNTIIDTTKSYISCAIGRINK